MLCSGVSAVVGLEDENASRAVSADGATLLVECDFNVSACVSISACGFPRVGGRSSLTLARR